MYSSFDLTSGVELDCGGSPCPVMVSGIGLRPWSYNRDGLKGWFDQGVVYDWEKHFKKQFAKPFLVSFLLHYSCEISL